VASALAATNEECGRNTLRGNEERGQALEDGQKRKTQVSSHLIDKTGNIMDSAHHSVGGGGGGGGWGGGGGGGG